MVEQIDTVLLPQIEKAVFAVERKVGRAQQGGAVIGHLCNYYHLEQYEYTLHHVKYADADLFDDPNTDHYYQYVFLRDLKMREALEVDTQKNTV